MQCLNRGATLSIFMGFLGFATPAMAAFDFSNYQSTLNKLYAEGLSPIQSGYKFTFTESPATVYFTEYIYNAADKSLSSKNYGYSFQFGAGPYTSTQLVNSAKNVILNTASFYNAGGGNTALINKGDEGDASDAANKRGEISTIYADFFSNYYDTGGGGGGAIKNDGIIGTVYGDFVRNFVRNNGSTIYGGAILNGVKQSNAETYITEINGNFISNYLNDRSGASGHGGAIANYRYIGTINGNFIGNYISSLYGGNPLGGAIYNASGLIDTINGDFYSNRATNTSFYYSTAAGGAILNFATINNLYGDYNGNYAIGAQSFGGAIFNQGKITNIGGDFVGNYVSGSPLGGAIANGNILSEIIFDPSVSGWDGVNENNPPPGTPPIINPTVVEIDSIQGNFIYNYASGSSAKGGAIYNSAKINLINADFTKNYVTGSGVVYGGAISNSTGGTISLVKNSSFYDNSATGTNGTTGLALGGAIYTYSNMNFVADNALSIFSGNYTQDIRGKIYNAIFIDTTRANTLNFDMENGGGFTFNDNITGGVRSGTTIDYSNHYTINISGDNQNVFTMSNDIINADMVNVTNAKLLFRESNNGIGAFKPNADDSIDAITNLNLDNATFDTNNDYLETINLGKYTAANDSFWNLDVVATNMIADVLNVNGDIVGKTNLVVYSDDYDFTNLGQILFASSTNNLTGTADSFEIFRVYGSPYADEYEILFEDDGTNNKNWYFIMNHATNPGNPNPPAVVSEVISYIALHAASLEQTRSMITNIGNQVAASHLFDPDCCIVLDQSYWSRPVNNLWISPSYQHSKIKKHIDMNANIYGIEAGFDRQFSENHKLGIFASYRSGDYNLGTKIDKYTSNEKSEIDIESMAAGLYYRYDKNRNWVFATAYAGIQDARFTTFGVDERTRGDQLGGSVELGHLYTIDTQKRYSIEPSIAARYAQIAFDDIRDEYGKEIEYKTVRQLEFELGAKLEKTYHPGRGTAKMHIKPSVVRSFTSNDSVRISRLGDIETYHDELLGRVEIGGKYSVNDAMHVSGTATYTFGNDYQSAGVRIGFNYAFGGARDKSRGRCAASGGTCPAPALPKLELPMVHFDFDKSVVRPDDRKLLEKAASDLKEHGIDEINVIGHTDIKGSFDYNVGLSLRRANAVERVLTELDIRVMDIRAESFSIPIADNKTIQGRALNRRVELELVPKKDDGKKKCK